MRISRIQVENFRPYFGRQTIDLSVGKQHVTVLQGVNGAGKTSLFIALNWCLYGEGHEDTGSLPCKHLMETLSEGESASVGVAVRFQHDASKYDFTRRFSVQLVDGKLVPGNDVLFSAVRIAPTGDAEEEASPTLLINKLIPGTARNYFFFDGEKIDEFAKAGNEAEVRDAVREVIGLRVVERGWDHLEKVGTRINSALRKKHHAGLATLLDRQKDAIAKRDAFAKHLDHLTGEITRAKKELADIDTKLQRLAVARPLAERRKAAEADLASAYSRRKVLEAAVADKTSRVALLLATGAMRDAHRAIESRRAKGEIPSAIRERFLRDLLDLGECICERPIRSGAPEELALRARMTKAVPAQLEDEVLHVSGEISWLGGSQATLASGIRAEQKRVLDCGQRVLALTKEIDELKVRIGELDVEEVQALESERTKVEQQKEDLMIERGHTEKEKAFQEAEIDKLTTDIARVKMTDRAQEKSRNAMTLAQEGAKALRKLYDLAAEEHRGDIERRTREIFGRLVWKNSQFTEIRLTKDYQLDVIDRHGVASRTEMSAGERQLLSLSFIAAMSQSAAKDAPFVIDTPLGRISGQPRRNLAEQLPQLAHQVVLFVTDTEYDAEVRRVLAPVVGRAYELRFDDDTGVTTVAEVPHA